MALLFRVGGHREDRPKREEAWDDPDEPDHRDDTLPRGEAREPESERRGEQADPS